ATRGSDHRHQLTPTLGAVTPSFHTPPGTHRQRRGTTPLPWNWHEHESMDEGTDAQPGVNGVADPVLEPPWRRGTGAQRNLSRRMWFGDYAGHHAPERRGALLRRRIGR